MTLEAAQSILSTLRSAKSEEEIAAMREAQGIAEAALAETLPLIRPGMSEQELAAELVYRMLRHGSEGNSFDPIVITGKRRACPTACRGRAYRRGRFRDDGLRLHKARLLLRHDAHRRRWSRDGGDAEYLFHRSGGAACRYRRGARRCPPGATLTALRAMSSPARDTESISATASATRLVWTYTKAPTPTCAAKRRCPWVRSSVRSRAYTSPGRFGVRIEDVMVLREDGAEVITRAPKMELIVLNNN